MTAARQYFALRNVLLLSASVVSASSLVTPEIEILTRAGDTILTRDGSTVIARTA